MPELLVTPLVATLNGRTLRQSCRIDRTGPFPGETPILWWDAPADLLPLAEGDADPFAVATIFLAMAEGRDLRLAGSIDPGLFARLEEFVVIWSLWRPDKYRRIAILPDRVRDRGTTIPDDLAVAAFSGGLDATFTILRHQRRLAGSGSKRIVAGALVHGFDVPLSETAKFDHCLLLAGQTLADAGIDVVPFRTNFRDLMELDWNDVHSAATIATLHFLKARARTALVAASHVYDHLLIPYGSTPLTDSLLSSGSMDVVHDGAGFDRCRKAEAVSKWAVGARNLRVCWQGTQVEANCGRCEKCLRTRLNFLAMGLEPPASLVPEGTRPELGLLDSTNEHFLEEYRKLLATARSHGIRDRWTRDLDRRLAWLRVRNASLRLVAKAKRLVRTISGTRR